MTDDQIKHMVSRFLAWQLPKNFSPDAGISFKPEFNEHTDYPMRHNPSGTNLFDAMQAEEMVRHMIYGLDQPPSPRERRLARLLQGIVDVTHSHVDGSDLLAELHPRSTLDIKRRSDGVETWHEGDWLTNLERAVKEAKAFLYSDRISEKTKEEMRRWMGQRASAEQAPGDDGPVQQA